MGIPEGKRHQRRRRGVVRLLGSVPIATFFSVTFIVCRIVRRVTVSPARESLNQHETSTFLDLPLVSDNAISGADRPEEADNGRRSGEGTVHAFRAGKVDAFKGGSY